MSMNPSCQECGEEDAERVLCNGCLNSHIAAAAAIERYLFMAPEMKQVAARIRARR